MRLRIKEKFLQLEAAGGIILFLSALAAFIIANSPWSNFYTTIFNPRVLFLVNDGLMTLFFLLVGLELKRECIEGELTQISQIMLPAVSAVGGMVVPAIIYAALNYHDPIMLRGWAIPVATDIAFALGVLLLAGKRIPISLKLFLMALAIFDDVGAILVIVIFYSNTLSLLYLAAAAIVFGILMLLNYKKNHRLIFYLLLGVLLWGLILKSGVHPTLAGILLALAIPISKTKKEQSPHQRLEQILHPIVAYAVMPFFAFANAGVSLSGIKPAFLLNSISLGIILGLFVGKQLGVFSFGWLIIKMGWAKLPAQAIWLSFYGVALLCGIGFTMSLFLGSLAFEMVRPDYLVQVRLGVIIGSLASGILGVAFLRAGSRKI